MGMIIRKSDYLPCEDRIRSYLENGGLFNPGFIEHDKVRELLLDCLEDLTNLRVQNNFLKNEIENRKSYLERCEKGCSRIWDCGHSGFLSIYPSKNGGTQCTKCANDLNNEN